LFGRGGDRKATRGSRGGYGQGGSAGPGQAVEVGMAREARYGLVLRGSLVQEGGRGELMRGMAGQSR